MAFVHGIFPFVGYAIRAKMPLAEKPLQGSEKRAQTRYVNVTRQNRYFQILKYFFLPLAVAIRNKGFPLLQIRQRAA